MFLSVFFSSLVLSKNSYIVFSRFYSKKVVRVRFAPSPTGFLHLGGLRTALYNFLFSKKYNGKFILRIEDTDQSRLVDGAIDELQTDLSWSGIIVDEGPKTGGDYGPYLQSERLHIYQKEIKTLIKNNSAYYCFCSDRRLNLLKKEALRLSQVPKYDNKCRYLTVDEVNEKLRRGEPHCIRFKLKSGVERFHDLIYGNIAYDISLNEGDPVILKSDGYPTYHFANVVDDHMMEISHVLRGVEWQISTTKHILMYKAFNWEPPIFGHLPLLLNEDGTKLSKRQGDIKIGYYRDKGIFPLALINFISDCGGGFSKDLESGLKPNIYTLSELAEQFEIRNINPYSGKIMPERLFEYNRLELKRKLKDEYNLKIFSKHLKNLIKEKYFKESDILHLDDDYISSIIKWSVNRVNCVEDLLDQEFAFLWVLPKHNSIVSKDDVAMIKLIREKLENNEFKKNVLKSVLKDTTEELKIPFSRGMKLLRAVLSGLQEGPSVVEMMEILGRENTIKRFDSFLKCRN